MTVKEKEKELFERYKKDGDRAAKRELVHSLTPLIRSQANKYKNSGIPYQALELEGKLLASDAIDNYDPSKGTQLNTYVTTHLRKLSRFTNQYQNVGHLPEPRALMVGKYNTIYSNLQEEKGREPTIEELSDSMQVPPAEIDRLQTELRSDLSMELPAADSDEGGFHTYILPDIEDPKTREAVQFVYFDSDPVDKKILEYIFGLGGVTKISQTEIKAKLRMTDSELRRRKKALGEAINELL